MDNEKPTCPATQANASQTDGQNVGQNTGQNAGLDGVSTTDAPMPTTPDAMLAHLSALGVDYHLYHHDPIFTVADGVDIEKTIPGTHGRNLFVRDKKGAMFLISAANETKIDLKAVADWLGCGRLSFASPERLWAYLGVRPGSVCPYAIINDKTNVVTPVLDGALLRAERVNFHPLINTMTIGVPPGDLIRFIESTGHTPRILD